ncbi:MAG: hypothetical protein ACK56I_03940, partial [bacterium]
TGVLLGNGLDSAVNRQILDDSRYQPEPDQQQTDDDQAKEEQPDDRQSGLTGSRSHVGRNLVH